MGIAPLMMQRRREPLERAALLSILSSELGSASVVLCSSQMEQSLQTNMLSQPRYDSGARFASDPG